MMRSYNFRIFLSLSMLLSLLLLFSGLNEYVMAAGSSSSSISKPDSAQEKRKKANVYFKKAERYEEQEKYKDAARQYKKVLKINPSYAEAHSNLGYCFRMQQKYKEAIRSYKQAIDLNPQLAEAHEYIGEAYAETGRFDLAERHLKILKTLDSSEAEELATFIAKMRDQG